MATIEPYTTKAGERRYRVRYRTPDRRQTDKRGFRTRRDANTFAATVEVDKITGGYIPPTAGRATIDTIGEQWQDGLVDVSESWRRRQESLWRVHVQPKWGPWQVAKIEPGDVQRWINALHAPTREPRPLAPKTIRHVHGVLASVLDVAVHDRRLVTNPARQGIRLPRTMQVEKQALTAEQVRALAAAAPEFYRPVVWFLATAGARWGEMSALRPKDMQGRGRVRLSRAYSKVDNGVALTDLKGHEARTVVVPPPVEDMLTEVAAGKDRDALLWEAPRTGGPLKPPRAGHWLGLAVAECHAADETFPEHLTAHELRHTAASIMISSGAHVKTIQRQLGHKDAAMTLNQYGHLFEDDLDVIADAMGTALFPPECGQSVGTAGVNPLPEE